MRDKLTFVTGLALLAVFAVLHVPALEPRGSLATFSHNYVWPGTDVLALVASMLSISFFIGSNWSKRLASAAASEPRAISLGRLRGSWHNPKANLASREMLDDQAAARNARGELCMVLLVGLDGFTRINEQFGYAFGDAVLQQVANRLLTVVSDLHLIAHLCSDKFVILEPRMAVLQDAQSLARHVLKSFDTQFVEAGTSVRLSASVGIAEAPLHGSDMVSLMQAATDALRAAKQARRGSWRVFDSSMHDTDLNLCSELPDAITAGELIPFYQPIVDLETGHVVGLEVLARWDHPTRGLLPPSQFIEMAERDGRLSEMTLWQLREVAHDAADWPDTLFFSFNIVPDQLDDFAGYASGRADRSLTTLAPNRIEVELTETARIKDIEGTRALVQSLHDNGTRVVLDDFGAGHGNFRHLCGIPFDRIKIDKEFVLNMLSDSRADLCVRSIIDTGRRFGVAVTAEGVASSEVAETVRALGCRFGQGSLYSMPVEARDVPALLASLAADAPKVAAHVGQAVAEVSARSYLPVPFERDFGVSMGGARVANTDPLWRNADATLYGAHSATFGQFRLGAPELQDPAQAKRLLELDMRAALAAKNFELHYAPVIDLRTGRVTGLKAKLRWQHERRGNVRPTAFIALAEEIGLIGDLGEWELRQACMEAANWPDELNVAVNVSATQVSDTALPTIVLSALRDAELRPSRLELEITDSARMEHDAFTLAAFGELRDAGVRITVGGFGAGHSALCHSASFLFDKIKIDRSLISRIAFVQDGRSAALEEIRAIAGLCVSLGVTCAAEGVETEEQYATLVGEGCIEAQGHLFGEPRTARDVPALLSRLNRDDGIMAGNPLYLPTGAISFVKIAETASDILVITGPSLAPPGPTILYVNPAFTRLTGYTAAESVGRSPRFLQGPGTSRATLDAIGEALRAGNPVREKILNFAKSGAPYWLDMRIVALRDASANITHFAAIGRDVTLDQRRLDELEFAADRDPLTGILNRRAFLRVVEAEIELTQSRGVASDGAVGPCLALIDVDHFKQVNDELGHAIGDAVLYGIADRIADHMRRSETLGRIGGEEFAVCFPGVGLCEGERLAERLRLEVAKAAFQTPCGPVPVTVSIGIAVFAEGDNLSLLMERADIAMYAAKRGGRDRVTADSSRHQ